MVVSRKCLVALACVAGLLLAPGVHAQWLGAFGVNTYQRDYLLTVDDPQAGLYLKSLALTVSANRLVFAGNEVYSGIGGSSDDFSLPYSYYWAGEGKRRPLSISSVNGMSRDGSVVVGGDFGAVRARIDRDRTLLAAAPAAALGVSGDGRITVGVDASGVATRWLEDGTAESLGVLPGDVASRAVVASFDGAVIAGTSDGEPFRWTAGGGLVGLGLPPGATSTTVTAISNDGATVLGTALPTRTPWIWRSGSGFQTLTTRSAEATALTADGKTVVGYFPGGGGNGESFIWTEASGAQDLTAYVERRGVRTAGWRLQGARAVSADGTVIAGIGSYLENRAAWVIRLKGSFTVPPFLVIDNSKVGVIAEGPRARLRLAAENARFVTVRVRGKTNRYRLRPARWVNVSVPLGRPGSTTRVAVTATGAGGTVRATLPIFRQFHLPR